MGNFLQCFEDNQIPQPFALRKMQVYIQLSDTPKAPQAFMTQLSELSVSDEGLSPTSMAIFNKMCERIESSDWFKYCELTNSY